MIFSEKTLRALLIAGSGVVAFFFWVLAAIQLVYTTSLTDRIPVEIFRWEVEEVKTDRYALKASYSYRFQEKNYEGTTRFEPVYMNEVCAISGIREAAKERWSAWVNPRRPEMSSLEKGFPKGLIARAAVATLVSVYFILIYRKKYFRVDF